MANGFLVVTKDTWEHMPKDQRDWMMFDTMQRMDARLKKVERQSLIHKGCAFAGGIVGGIIGFFTGKVV